MSSSVCSNGEKKSQKSDETGLVFVFAFVVLGAIQDVCVGNLVQNYDPILVMTVTFFIASLYFNIVAIKKRALSIKMIRQHIFTVFTLNLTTALSWLGFMVSLKYLEPAIVSCICFSVGPILTSVLNPVFNNKKKVLPSEFVSSIGLLAGVVFLSQSSIIGGSGLGTRPSDETTFGILAALVSALGIMANTFYSKKMSNSGFNTLQTMSLRFYFLILCGVFFLAVGGKAQPMGMNFCVEMVVLSFATVVLPLFLLQKGIERLEPITISLIVASMPVLTFFFQLFDTRLVPSLLTLVGVFICFASAVAGVLSRYVFKKEMA